MLKFDRNYRAEFEIGRIEDGKFFKEQELIVQMPFTIDLDIDIGTYGAPNLAVFQFYNLNKQDQQSLWYDTYNAGSKYIVMAFYAGYGDEMPLIFQGQVVNCYSHRDSGSVDTITTMQVMSGSFLFQYGYANSTYQKGTKYANVIASLLNDIPDATLGYVTDDLLEIPRNQTFMGQTMDLLKRELSGYNVYEDLGEVHVLKDKDVIPGEVIAITEKSGMLGTPKQSNQSLEVSTIFEPSLRCSQLIYLSSEYNLIKKQTYKIVRIKHSGTISPVVCGNLTTHITLFYGDIKKEWNLIEKKGLRDDAIQTPISATGWIKPVDGAISSSYGYRLHPIRKVTTFHDGIDIAADYNKPVKAIKSGVVTTAEIRGGYGNYIIVSHGKDDQGNIFSSAYGHLSKFAVSSGQRVNQGDVIGYIGSTGKDSKGNPTSTGPHLHLQIFKNGQTVNPVDYIGAY